MPSPATSLGYPFLLERMAPIWTGGVTVDQLSSYRYVGKISPSAFFLIVESRDRMIPPSSNERLFDLAGNPKYIWKGIDAAHVEAYFKYPEEYQRRVLAFYGTYLLGLPMQSEILPQ